MIIETIKKILLLQGIDNYNVEKTEMACGEIYDFEKICKVLLYNDGAIFIKINREHPSSSLKFSTTYLKIEYLTKNTFISIFTPEKVENISSILLEEMKK